MMEQISLILSSHNNYFDITAKWQKSEKKNCLNIQYTEEEYRIWGEIGNSRKWKKQKKEEK